MPNTIATTHLSLYVHQNPQNMAEEAAEIVLECAERAIKETGKFNLAISGGRTPIPLFDLLSSPDWEEKIEWRKTNIFWVDERCVGPENKESNYGMARSHLLSHVEATSYYRIRGEEDPERAARLYEQQLEEHFGVGYGEIPRFDCILLGVGDDGHTASLFPGDRTTEVRDKLVIAVRPKGEIPRVTMTLPVLNNAKCCVFMAEGRGKNHVISTALNLMAAPQLPAQMVRPSNGRVCWIIDELAFQG